MVVGKVDIVQFARHGSRSALLPSGPGLGHRLGQFLATLVMRHLDH
jgi:hypothetical protein